MDVIKEENVGLVENIIFFQELFTELTPQLDMSKVEEINFTEKAELFLDWSNEFEELYADIDWSIDDYPEKIEAFVKNKLKERFGNGEDD